MGSSCFFTFDGSALTSNKDDWGTPQYLYDNLNSEFHFTLDAAANEANAKCSRFYSLDNSAFDHDWSNEIVFLNPPYGRDMIKWISKAYREVQDHHAIVVLLVPSRTDTRWFHDYIYKQYEIRFIRGRLKYEIAHGVVGASAPFPSMIVVMK